MSYVRFLTRFLCLPGNFEKGMTASTRIKEARYP